MSDLYLTDKQIQELKSMEPLGQEAVHALWLWRECPAAPWDGISLAAIFRSEFDKNEPTSAFDAVEATICYSHNTAELRAALVYWTEKKHKCREAYSHQLEQGLSVGDEWEGWGNLAAANIFLSTICEALKEMRT